LPYYDTRLSRGGAKRIDPRIADDPPPILGRGWRGLGPGCRKGSRYEDGEAYGGSNKPRGESECLRRSYRKAVCAVSTGMPTKSGIFSPYGKKDGGGAGEAISGNAGDSGGLNGKKKIGLGLLL